MTKSVSRARRSRAVMVSLAAAAITAAGIGSLGAQQPSRTQPGPPQMPGQPAQAAPPALSGVWLDDTGEGAVEIIPCGDRLCGRIVWLKAPTDKAGQPLTDGYNPEAAKRRRPICGLQVIGNLRRVGGDVWDAGWIYDPKDGKSYDVEIRPKGEKLLVTGYLGVKFLSESFLWTRAPAALPRCAALN